METDIARDPVRVDPGFPPDMKPLFFEGRLLGLIYMANGKGPHKTVLLLHGFPGNEKNFDLAHMLRRGGYNVVIFHYSGSWGSRGTYSFGQAYEDLRTVRSAMDCEEFASEYRIDRTGIFLAGHSVGGFLSLLAARDKMDFCAFAALAPYNLSLQGQRIEKSPDQYAAAFELFSGGLNPLKGTTAESLVGEIVGKRQQWDLFRDEVVFADRKMLLVIASLDEVAPPPVHQRPVAEMFARVGGPKTVATLCCSHDFSEKRVTLAETLFEWLES